MENAPGQVDPLRLPSETSLAFWVLLVSVAVGTSTYTRLTASLVRGWIDGTAPVDDAWNWLVGPLFVISLVTLLYFTEPARILLRSGGAVQLPKDDGKRQRIEYLSKMLHIHAPRVWVSKLGLSADAQAFGALAPNLLVGRGLALVFTKSPSTFDAIVLHELGHVIHKDIRKGYLARAVLQSYLALIVANLVVLHGWYLYQIFFKLDCTSAGWTLSQCAFVDLYRFIANTLIFIPLTAISVLAYSTFLRYREFYADQVAASHGGMQELTRMFRGSAPRSLSLKQRLMAFHPSPLLRAKALVSPVSIFDNSKWLMLQIGMLAGAAFTNFDNLLPLSNFMNGVAAVVEKMLDPEVYGPGMPVQALMLGLPLVLALSVVFVALIRVGARGGLIIASARQEAERTIREMLVCLCLFVTGFQILGPLLVNMGPWMERGLPPNAGHHLFGEIPAVTLFFGTGLLGSAIPGFVAGRYFQGDYRPRITLLYSYYCGWALMNYGAALLDTHLSPPPGYPASTKTVVVLLMILGYVVIPGLVVFFVDKLLQRRAQRSAISTGQDRMSSSLHWLLRRT